jgi:hypothetical protein
MSRATYEGISPGGWEWQKAIESIFDIVPVRIYLRFPETNRL